MRPGGQRQGAVAWRRATLILVLSWALTEAVLCAATFAQSEQPAPNPADASPFPGGNWFGVMLITFLPALLLAARMQQQDGPATS